MTFRQKILKAIYPLLVAVSRRRSAHSIHTNSSEVKSPVPFHSLQAELIGGKPVKFDTLRGKKVLLVNTASDCGYTAQYAELQKLHEMMKNELTIIGFPANDFKEQEKESDEKIAQFCSRNFGVNFQLARKSVVVKGSDQNPVYQWLSDRHQNGWNDTAPSWNFSKYLVDEDGNLLAYIEPSVSPLSEDMIKLLES